MKKIASFWLLVVLFLNLNAQWQQTNLAAPFDLTNVQMVSASTGYMTCMDGIYMTTNGGSQWNKLHYVQPDSLYFQFTFNYDLHFSNLNDGLVCGYAYNDSKGAIIGTSDGGTTWDVRYLGPINVRYVSMAFSDATKGVAVGTTGNIIYTQDAGINWQNIVSGVTTPLNAVDFAPNGNGVGVIATNGALLRSTNHGLSWSSITIAGQNFISVNFATDNIVYAKSTQNKLYKSTDAGQTWQALATNMPSSSDIFFTSATTGYACGTYIYRTTDGGNVWEVYQPGNTTTFIYFYNGTLGICGGHSTAYITGNAGGSNWSPIISIAISGANTCTDSTYYFQTTNSPGYTYQWRLNGQLISTQAADSAVMIGTGTADTLSVSVSNGYNTVTTQSIFTTLLPIGFSMQPLRINRDSVCKGQTATLYVDSSRANTQYQFIINGTNSGSSVTGNGGTLNFTTPALYADANCTIKATRYSSACGTYSTSLSRYITLAVPDTVAMAVMPTHVCRGDTGRIVIPVSQANTSYSLYNGTYLINTIAGTGGPIILQTYGQLNNTFRPTVKATSAVGCVATMPPLDSFYVRQLTTSFTRIPDVFVGQNIQLQNLSNGDNYYWTFDASASTAMDTAFQPSISYNTVGDKIISLRATTTEGCDDTVTQRVRVYTLADTTAPNAFCHFDTIANDHLFFIVTAHHIDRFGNQYIATYKHYWDGAYSGGSYHCALSKYDSDGNLIWQKTTSPNTLPFWISREYNGSYITGISTDAYNNIYLSGSFSGQEFELDTLHIYNGSNQFNNVFFIAKLDSSGNGQWLKRSCYNSNYKNYASDIVYVDDNTILASVSGYGCFYDTDTTVYIGSSTILQFNSNGKYQRQYPFKMSLHNSVTYTGLYNTHYDGYSYHYLVKVDPKMHLRADGKVVMIGQYKSKLQLGDSITLGIDSITPDISGYAATLNPNVGWQSAFTTYQCSSYNFPYYDVYLHDIESNSAVAANGDIYISRGLYARGSYQYGPNSTITLSVGNIAFPDSAAMCVLMRYSTTGQLKYATKVNTRYLNSLAFSDLTNEIFLAGEYTKTAGFQSVNGAMEATYGGTEDAYLAAYDTSGNFKWMHNIGGIERQTIQSIKIACGGTLFGIGATINNAYMVGGNIAYNSYKNMFLKYDAANSNCVQQTCPAYVTLHDTLYNCPQTIDTTYTYSTLGIKDSTTVYGSVNSIDIRHGYDTITTTTVISTTDTAVYAYTLHSYDSSQAIYFTNNVDSAVCTGSNQIGIAVTYIDTMYITRTIVQNPTGLAVAEQDAMYIYPNPGSSHLFIGNAKANIAEVRIYDLAGALCKTVLAPVDNKIQVDDLTAGVYTIQIFTPLTSLRTRWIKQ